VLDENKQSTSLTSYLATGVAADRSSAALRDPMLFETGSRNQPRSANGVASSTQSLKMRSLGAEIAAVDPETSRRFGNGVVSKPHTGAAFPNRPFVGQSVTHFFAEHPSSLVATVTDSTFTSAELFFSTGVAMQGG
jgi:hypothetical protein